MGSLQSSSYSLGNLSASMDNDTFTEETEQQDGCGEGVSVHRRGKPAPTEALIDPGVLPTRPVLGLC